MILFFRMGDFYETFDEDARTISEVLDIALTSREMGRGTKVPMAGIPYHSADSYLSKLLAAGHRVAIAEQVSEPTGRGIVDRRVTSIVTPGTVTSPELLTSADNTFIAAIISRNRGAGLAFADVTTGEFAVTSFTSNEDADLVDQVRRELLRISPLEILTREDEPLLPILPAESVTTPYDKLIWREDEATETLLDHFNVASLEPFGCDREPLAISAAGALLAYLQHTQMNQLRQITTLYRYSVDSYMHLDSQTMRNLELERSSSRGDGPSLIQTIDATRTSVGGRLLRRWLSQPLISADTIEGRYDGVQWFIDNALARNQVRDQLDGMSDIERIINRAVNNQAGPREIRRLGEALDRLPSLANTIDAVDRPDILKHPPDCTDIAREILAALREDAPTYLGASDAIAAGYSAELDALRRTLREDREFIANLEAREREQTGIERMKVGYNKVFGYYLEISNANRNPVPDHYIRKQTLVNAERYITPELKEAEQRVATAEERIAAAESDAFQHLIASINMQADLVREASACIAVLDTIASLAEIASVRGYVRPEITDADTLEISHGRHPIVEVEMPGGEFVPNDTTINDDDGRIHIITGPNMAGKSTYLRQVALIVLMAQIGSFVPASSMEFGIVDRIFTRLGAQDDLAGGQSTFMVEMLETATILNHATPRSLVVLDEIGRGTSTYDGLAIATAIVEFIHNTPGLRSKTLFATHYHELTTLAETLPGVSNYRVDVLETGDEITFLYRVVPGGADRSYGIYVAQLAGMPEGVIRRARDILRELEKDGHRTDVTSHRRDAISSQPFQMTMFGENHPVLQRLQDIEVDALSPLEAITRLYELKKLAE